jgi:hypothetical protein
MPILMSKRTAEPSASHANKDNDLSASSTSTLINETVARNETIGGGVASASSLNELNTYGFKAPVVMGRSSGFNQTDKTIKLDINNNHISNLVSVKYPSVAAMNTYSYSAESGHNEDGEDEVFTNEKQSSSSTTAASTSLIMTRNQRNNIINNANRDSMTTRSSSRRSGKTSTTSGTSSSAAKKRHTSYSTSTSTTLPIKDQLVPRDFLFNKQ